MEVIAVAAIIVLIAFIMLGQRPPTQPSFIITPIDEHTYRHGDNSGCLIASMMLVAVIFIVVLSST